MRKKLYVYNNKKRVFNKLYIYILEKITRIIDVILYKLVFRYFKLFFWDDNWIPKKVIVYRYSIDLYYLVLIMQTMFLT